MKNTDLTSEFIAQKTPFTKYGKRSLPNGSSGRIIGRGGTRGDRPKVSRNVHANIDFSELNEVCLDVGKVDLSHAARFSHDSGLSPYKCSREITGNNDVSCNQGVNGHESYYSSKYGDNLKHMISCYVQLGMRPSKLMPLRSPKGLPMKRKIEDEDWKGWDSKISFLKQHGCPVVSVNEPAKSSHILVMTEDLVDRECQLLGIRNGFSCYRGNFEKCVLGVNEEEQSLSAGEKNCKLKNKLREYFEDRGELNLFLESLDCSVLPSSKRVINRQLNFSEVNNQTNNNNVFSHTPGSRVYKAKTSDQTESQPVESFCGFSQTAIIHSNKRARKFLDFYTKIKNSCLNF